VALKEEAQLAQTDRATRYVSAYELLLVFHSKYVSILHRFWDIARCWWKIANLNLPHLYLLAHP